MVARTVRRRWQAGPVPRKRTPPWIIHELMVRDVTKSQPVGMPSCHWSGRQAGRVRSPTDGVVAPKGASDLTIMAGAPRYGLRGGCLPATVAMMLEAPQEAATPAGSQRRPQSTA